MSTITNDKVVTLSYTVADSDGNLLKADDEQLQYLHGGYGGIFAPVEAALEGQSVGCSVTVKLQPADAFGEYDPELVDMVPVEQLPQPLEVGMQLEGTVPDDSDAPPAYATVTDIADGKAVLDANHPLAGMALVFECTVVAVRDATGEELAQVRERHTH
ncbi:FKBP-type peptidyl-prolyl cis-trans isomerase [Geomonas limicola]|uniref:peptidylprolyl isomerase n=1 Tax=Geomonas limicola TaxID=2740186 RepID=A0A6V8NE51_9BACT|nr:peptidylprolyl isomerase [Geomonas limicola]GFO70057.1 FKBP-type peptidyl-prolyl cis-trans isomerase [Geomonas limicola]